MQSARTLFTAVLLTYAAYATAADQQLAGVIFEGVSHYSPETLLPLYRADLGRPVDGAMQERIATGLVACYDADGFLRPVVELPTRDTNAGVLVFNVKEPAVRRVALSGKEFVTNPEFWQRLAELKRETPLARRSFHDWLARVNQTDGMFVTGTISPFGNAGADYLAQLRVTPNPFTAMLHVDNQAPEALGNNVVQGQVAYRFSNALAGQISAAAAVAVDVDRLELVSLAGAHGFDDAGHAFEWSASRSKSKLDSGIPDETNDYERSRATVGLRSPLYRGAAITMDAWTVFRLYDVDQFDSAGTLLRKDRTRSAILGVTTSVMGSPTRRHDLTLTTARGFDVFGARAAEPGTAQQPDIDFLRFELVYLLTQRIGEYWNTSLVLQGQWSADHLPESERFLIGGRQLGGAFDPASVTGDRGAGARAEFSRMQTLPRLESPLLSYLYVDYGVARSNNPDFASDSASSAGTGLRLSFGNFTGSVEVATPLREPNSNPLAKQGTRVFFALTKVFM